LLKRWALPFLRFLNRLAVDATAPKLFFLERVLPMLSFKGRVGYVGLLALGVLCTGAQAQAQTLLRYKFKPGEKLRYQMEQKMNMVMTVTGREVTADMTQTIDMSWEIKSVDQNGKAKMTQKFDRVRFTMNGPPPIGKVEYDSKEGTMPAGPFGPIFKAMAGAEFSAVMDPRGKVSDVKAPEKLAEVFKKLPGSGAGEMLSEEGLKHMISQSGIILPEEAVAKGKSWEQKVDMKMPFGKIDVRNTFTYEGPTTRGGAKLEQIAIQPKANLEADPNAAIKLKLNSQEAKGTAYFDNAAGRLAESGMTQTMEMEVSVMGTDITQKIEQKISLKLQDKAEGK
jgi:hypothetical protein